MDILPWFILTFISGMILGVVITWRAVRLVIAESVKEAVTAVLDEKVA